MITAFVITAASSGDPILDWLSRAGAMGVLSLAVIAFLRGWIITQKEHERAIAKCDSDAERLIAERDRALNLVYQQAELAKAAIGSLERVRDTIGTSQNP